MEYENLNLSVFHAGLLKKKPVSVNLEKKGNPAEREGSGTNSTTAGR